MSVALQRTAEPSLVNALANDPAIRDKIGVPGSEPVDLTPLLQNERNIALMGEHGGFVYIWCAPACYEVHTMVLKPGRGPWALEAAKLSLEAMFDIYGARHVWTRVLSTEQHVRNFTIAAGLTPCGLTFFDFDGEPKEYHLYERRA